MSNDVTKPLNHIFWLWSAVVAMAIAGVAASNALRDRDDCLAKDITSTELVIKIQLAEIKTTLASVEATLIEMKRDIKRRNEP